MMKYAAANSGSSDSHQKSKLLNEESSATPVFSEQIRSKKLNQSSTIQSGMTIIVITCVFVFYNKHVSLFYKNIIILMKIY